MKKALLIVLNVSVYLFAFLYISPIVWTIFSSFKEEKDLFSWPPKLISQPTLTNFVQVLHRTQFGLFFRNSFVVSLSATLVTVLISVMGGYALAKYQFRFKNYVSTFILSTLMIPLQVIMVPIYLVLSKLGMINTLWGLIIPPAATPTGIFLAQKYMISAIPDSVIESARIDGANEFQIFFRIVLPLSQPLVAALAVLSFTWRWNDFLWPLIVVGSPKLYTIQLALGTYAGEHIVQWGPLLAMTVLSMVPVLIVFIALQKYFVKGITTGAIK
ncbi:carbohydrate ABC transporter permease [Thermotoga caldifontis]|uniref:carbohydrate ABC transporter permease n=1 Tax=Thermotoga caldifontis TaxID=1508419 RepID=UPI0005971A62|nr:carbohydrate ABC transporter permease [Thermotoga caldifontis]